jgi:hypothetical protein
MLVRKYHYSHRPAENVQFVGLFVVGGGLFGDSGEPVAGACFSIPPTRWKEPVLELSRLVRSEEQVPLTRLISLCCKDLRRRKWDLLVSFADKTQGHDGGVYRAASWNYGGCRDRRMDGVMVDGEFYPGRTCNSLWGTRSPRLLQKRWPSKVIEPHYDEGKHLYWRPLTHAGKKRAVRIGLQIKRYKGPPCPLQPPTRPQPCVRARTEPQTQCRGTDRP